MTKNRYKHTQGLTITPYNSKEKLKVNFSDTYLKQVFLKIAIEGTLHKIYFDKKINNNIEFISFIKQKQHSVFFVKAGKEEVGFFWLAKFNQRSAFMNYCFFKSFWGKKSLTISRFCIEYILERKNENGDYMLDILLGLTPINNRLAVNFLIKSGMQVLGKIPGICTDYHQNKVVDGLLSYKTRNTSKMAGSSIFYPHSIS
ncbi:MAG: hypothetical protein U9R57_02520 [Thermodesulfobacteriota bacterium]|nr:hypothetical protein [Thermodesulfobacteriota bacterium]